MNARNVMENTLNGFTPKMLSRSLFNNPALGLARMTHDTALSSEGRMNDAYTAIRNVSRPGKSVRETSQAIGTPIATHRTITVTPSRMEFQTGPR